MKPLKLFLVISAVLLAALATFLFNAARTTSPATPSSPSPLASAPLASAPLASAPLASAPPAPPPDTAKAPEPAPAVSAPRPTDLPPQRLFFRHNAVDSHYGRLAFLEPPFDQARQYPGDLVCEAVHFAGGRGVCLTANRGVFTTYSAVIFDQDFRRLFSVPLAGAPSRCRMSPDGRWAGVTAFRSGHSYTSADFTTQTLILDAKTGQILFDLENLVVSKDRSAFRAADFNFWGVTFTPDSRSFYCTLSSQRQHYLVKAEIATRAAVVLRSNVECPSLSPDGNRVAYKKRIPDSERVRWRLHVLDLRSQVETPLPELRNVDDQIEWLDQQSILYALPDESAGNSGITNIWHVNVDKPSAPLRLVNTAYSPAVVR